MINAKGTTIKITQCSEPGEKVKQINRALRYLDTVLPRKKSVWHPSEHFKNQKSVNQYVAGG
jgi:hypothetical protein